MFSESLFLKSFQFPEKTASLTSLAVFVISIYIIFVFILDFVVVPAAYLDNIARFHDEILVHGLNVIHVDQKTLVTSEKTFITQFFFDVIKLSKCYKALVIGRVDMA